MPARKLITALLGPHLFTPILLAHATSLPPIVSPTWLATNLANAHLITIDLRDTPSYNSNHIPTSLSLPFQTTPLWSSNGPNNTLVMPPPSIVTTILPSIGLTPETWTILIPDAAVLPSHMAMATRAAATLRYAGLPVSNMAILDGGYPAWVASNLSVSRTPTTTTQAGTRWTGEINGSFVVDRDYVRARIGKKDEGVVLIDARTAADYRAGHIESAVSLPAGGIWGDKGVWKGKGELEGLFGAAVGEEVPVGRDRGEVVVYCRTGMLATTWVYVLVNVLGFGNVKLYDGSMEDWVGSGGVVVEGEE